MAPQAPPYMYTAYNESSRFSQSSFDPKAITRASWEPKLAKPKQDGPLISFNRHPDAHMVLTHRSSQHTPMSSRTKKAIYWLRKLLLGLRALQLNGAIGILVLMILLDKIETVSAWVMRITPGAVIAHCLYAVYHLSRDAAGRTPTSSAAYQIFASVVDLCTLGLYAYSALTVHNDAAHWSTRLADQDLLKYFVPAVYYTLVGSGGLHLISLSCSLWLSWAFRRISLMPPDMNPLEDNLTARPMHKKNRSSASTMMGDNGSGGNSSSTLCGSPSKLRDSQQSISSAPSMPFMHTRAGSRTSLSTYRDSRDLPSRQYQVPRWSGTPSDIQQPVEANNHFRPKSSYRGSYTQVAMSEPISAQTCDTTDDRFEPSRKAKFTETWAPTDSLISRTNQRQRDTTQDMHTQNTQRYSALTTQYNMDDVSDLDDSGDEEPTRFEPRERDLAQSLHPNPLRLNPPPSETTSKNTDRANTPFYPLGQGRPTGQRSLQEINDSEQRISDSQDITDELHQEPSSRDWQSRRHHTVQTEIGFYSKPYGELKSATPPVIVGNDRKVSSGNDYDSRPVSMPYGRRNVSGKAAEEGRAGGNKLSRYGFGQYVGKNY